MAGTERLAPAGPTADRRAVVAWCLYDWANSAFPTIVQTFVFSTYFVTLVAADPEVGNAQLGLANTLAAAAIALFSPVIGAIADQSGRRKPWLLLLTLVSVVATAGLWFIQAEPADVALGLVLFGVATLGFELGTTFYNAMMADMVPTERLGRVSGWGWGAGYAGGLACLIVGQYAFVLPDPSPLGLDRSSYEHYRIVMPLAALWFAVFALPLFLFVPDRPPSGQPLRRTVTRGIRDLAATLRSLRDFGDIARFLLAKMIYIDGLNTLFLFGGAYAGVSIGMSLEEVFTFGILLNTASGLGAVAFAWIDDWIGAKPTIMISLVALALLGVAVLLVHDKDWFYALALGLGLFFGPTQAASRSLMARLAPPERRAEFFGLYNFAGKATAFLGPALFGLATYMFDSQRVGLATILPFFVIGLIILWPVREPRAATNAGNAAAS
jgi:UMF1 family MFS transporter